MKKITKLLMVMMFFATTSAIFAQTITGTVNDETGPLPGANVIIKGTTNGTTTDFDGKFSLNVAVGSGKVVISFIGYTSKEVAYTLAAGETKDLGVITLASDNTLDEVVVIGRGVIDLEEDRQTPIAVSTISRIQIQESGVGNVEFPEIMKNTPNVYVSNQSGGFGDSQMFLRGFSQNNTAFLLNGQPINGMEDGNMYWSNWSGMSDIANAVQVQRGLGSSKLAISSVGGTVNIVTKATDKVEGGFTRALVGNDSYFKGTVAYNTGLSDSGWGFSFLLDYWQGYSKYANGTKGQGQNYFFSVGKLIGNHNINFLLTGAPQWHDQNFSKSMGLYDKYGIKYNNNYGFLNGEYLTSRRNYYHKPVLNFNWDWNISNRSELSTVLYASFGRGGGTGTYGNGPNYVSYPDDLPDDDLRGAYKPSNGLIDWDYIVNNYNPTVANGVSTGYNGTLLRASVNNHAWYGVVSNFNYDTENNWKFNAGYDLRWYKGDHFRELTNLLGLNGRSEALGSRPSDVVVSATFKPDPWAALFNYADESERINYDYSEQINYQGLFGQVEYALDKFSMFFQGAISNQSYERTDRGNFTTPKTSDKINRSGYNLKGGASYSVDEKNTFFTNIGQYSRQPFLDNIFPSYSDNTEIADPKVDNEEIFGFEIGYKYESDNFKANVNYYITNWKNRFLNAGGTYDTNGDGVPEYDDVSFLFTNIAQLHKGIEFDMQWRVQDNWRLNGYATFGSWKYDGSTPIRVRDNTDQQFVADLNANLTGTKVGLAPQTAIGIGTDIDVTNDFSLDAHMNNYKSLYGFVDVEEVALASLNGESYQSERLDNYTLFDVGASYKFNLGSNSFKMRGNVYNLFNNKYINQRDQYGYFYGNGTTWNFSVQYNFK